MSPEIGSPEIGSPEIGSPEIGSPEIGSPEIGSSAPDDYQSVQDVTWTLTNTGNTNSAYTAYVHVDNPRDYDRAIRVPADHSPVGRFWHSDELRFDELPAGSHHLDHREPRDRFTGDRFPRNRLPRRSVSPTFAMGPSDSPTSSGASGFAAMSLLSTAFQAPDDDGTLKAPKAPESVKVTLRAYKLTDSEHIFNPNVSDAGDRDRAAVEGQQ